MSSSTTRSQIGSDDIKWYDGVNATFTRLTSTGGSLTLNAIGGVVDVLEAYGGGTAYTTAAIQAAVDAIGTTTRALWFRPGSWAITSDITIPANATVICPPGAVFTVATTKTLTINGTIEAGPYQIFSWAGTGAVVFGANAPVCHRVYPAWWYSGTGYWDDAMAKSMAAVKNAGTGGTLVLTRPITLSTTYTHDYPYANLDGGGFLIDASAITSGNAIKVTSTDTSQSPYYQAENWIGNFQLKGNSKTGTVHGLFFEGTDSSGAAAHCTLKNANIYLFGTAIEFSSYSYEFDSFKTDIHQCTLGIHIADGGTDYGARLQFFGGIIFGCTTAIKNYQEGTVVSMVGGSIDSCAMLADITDGMVELHGAWVENIGYLASSAAEAVKVDNSGASFAMFGGFLYGGASSGNYDYFVNVVDATCYAVIRDTYVYGITPAQGYWATGNGIFDFQPMIPVSNADSDGIRFASVTGNDLADGGFEGSGAGGQLQDDWYIIDGGTFTTKYNCSNVVLASSGDYARTGSYSLKITQSGTANMTWGLLVPVRRIGSTVGWNAYYKKPGSGTGEVYITSNWVKIVGVDANGVPIIGDYSEVGSQTITFASGAVDWTTTTAGYMDLSANGRSPAWATHFLLKFNFNAFVGTESVYLDDVNVSIN